MFTKEQNKGKSVVSRFLIWAFGYFDAQDVMFESSEFIFEVLLFRLFKAFHENCSKILKLFPKGFNQLLHIK